MLATFWLTRRYGPFPSSQVFHHSIAYSCIVIQPPCVSMRLLLRHQTNPVAIPLWTPEQCSNGRALVRCCLRFRAQRGYLT